MFVSRKKFNNLKKTLSTEIDTLKASKEELSLELEILKEDPFVTSAEIYKSVFGYNFGFVFKDKCYSDKAQEILDHLQELSKKIELLEDENKKLDNKNQILINENEELDKENDKLNKELKDERTGKTSNGYNSFFTKDYESLNEDIGYINGKYVYYTGCGQVSTDDESGVATIVKDFFSGENIVKQTSNKVVHLDKDGVLLEGGYTTKENDKGFDYILIRDKVVGDKK